MIVQAKSDVDAKTSTLTDAKKTLDRHAALRQNTRCIPSRL